MKDETYVFISDVREKKITARSARHARTHCGKGGRVRLPSDNLSKKELMKMNGECKSFKLNDPMAWKEFKAMPDDIQITYIKLLRQKFNVPDAHIANMMGINKMSFSEKMKSLGLSVGKHKRSKWDKEGFYAWWHGVDNLPEPVPEEPVETPVVEEMAIEESVQEEPEVVISAEPEAFAEDDFPFDIEHLAERDPICHKLPELHIALCAEIDELRKRNDELLKRNEELMATSTKQKEKIAWLELRVDELGVERLMLEKQMDVVRLIFGGKNNG